ncbi:MAG: hypothetical protein QOE36_2462 [Gaiellaceae bacterium]|nr:hypothetical protein [Gaiellaceae bacterium]
MNDSANSLRRILVVANETAAGTVLRDAIIGRFGNERPQVLVVAPALNGRIHHWLSDLDGARRAAEQRLIVCVERLEAVGIEAEGIVGDADPLLAIWDALRAFTADEIVIVTHPESRSHWLARNVVARVRRVFALPVVHVISDASSAEGSATRGGTRPAERLAAA